MKAQILHKIVTVKHKSVMLYVGNSETAQARVLIINRKSYLHVLS